MTFPPRKAWLGAPANGRGKVQGHLAGPPGSGLDDRVPPTARVDGVEAEGPVRVAEGPAGGPVGVADVQADGLAVLVVCVPDDHPGVVVVPLRGRRRPVVRLA